jgi:hypothetical protein
VAPAAAAVGLVGEAGLRAERPFIPSIDFQELVTLMTGDPDVVLKDKTMYGERGCVLMYVCVGVGGGSRASSRRRRASGARLPATPRPYVRRVLFSHAAGCLVCCCCCCCCPRCRLHAGH